MANAAEATNVLPVNPPVVSYSMTSAVLTSAWVKVATVTKATKALRLAPLASATTFDIEWTVVPAGNAAPTDTVGEPIFGGEDFAGGLPAGDVYAKSASGQTVLIKVGA